jgi:hypothetical protein
MAVTPETIAVALGVPAPPVDSTQYAQWSMWIDDAYMLIEVRAEAFGKTLADLDEAKVDFVVRSAVVAHIKRPDDATTVMVSVDDASSQKTYQSGKGRVWILDEWWVILGLVSSTGAFTVDRAPGLSMRHQPWCDVTWGQPCSCGAILAGLPLWEY